MPRVPGDKPREIWVPGAREGRVPFDRPGPRSIWLQSPEPGSSSISGGPDAYDAGKASTLGLAVPGVKIALSLRSDLLTNYMALIILATAGLVEGGLIGRMLWREGR